MYVSDEQLAPFYESPDDVPGEKPPQEMIDVPPEKPTITLTQQEIDRLLIQDPAIKEAKLRIYAAYQEGMSEEQITRILKQEYRDSGGVIRRDDKTFLRRAFASATSAAIICLPSLPFIRYISVSVS